MSLIYDPKERKIYHEFKNLTKKIIDENHPSEPVISPDNNFAVYISPFEWEEIGSIYLLDLENISKEKIYEPKSNNLNPKYLTWINNEKLAVVLGYAYGTIAAGGNVFSLDISTRELTQLTHFPNEIQINSISMENNTLNLSGIKYTDSEFINNEVYYSKINLNT